MTARPKKRDRIVSGETHGELLTQAIPGRARERAFVSVVCGVRCADQIGFWRRWEPRAPIAKIAAKVRTADSGTLFLDEIGEMPLQLQSSCCGCCRSGNRASRSDKVTKVDIRVIAATNVDLQKRVNEGTFADLYYRLSFRGAHSLARLRRRPARDLHASSTSSHSGDYLSI